MKTEAGVFLGHVVFDIKTKDIYKEDIYLPLGTGSLHPVGQRPQ